MQKNLFDYADSIIKTSILIHLIPIVVFVLMLTYFNYKSIDIKIRIIAGATLIISYFLIRKLIKWFNKNNMPPKLNN
ncbi:hypothetical protein HOD20_09440 [archaeon]|jgi:hypothetical protein|nr:hypothetical protein [archaeon]MBT4646964.1 hypothetical protein [archaeon]MBT6822559.1 hypothetical protein [archaeon]MBT7392744.1 hypothetical protein [archaeon]